MTSIDIPASQQTLAASLPLPSASCLKRRRLCFENLEPGGKRTKTVSESRHSTAYTDKKKDEVCLEKPVLASTTRPRPRPRSPSLAAKDGEKASSPCVVQDQLTRRLSKSSPKLSSVKPTDKPIVSVPSTKKKLRPALQTIHIKALEHGLRIPVNNTPLGILDKSENIIYGSLSNPLQRPMSARPAVSASTHQARDTMTLARRPLAPSSAASVRGSQSAPASPARPRKLDRRNTTGSARSKFILEI
ncbi:hypothetical protein GGF40_001636 [Coemansia sp. RSA 1286]|nr:hypothetical protein GGF40_001636 [Coemansia sp. RSA 1286]